MNKTANIGVVFLSGAGLDSGIWEQVIGKINAPCVVADYTKVRQNSNNGLAEYVQAAREATESLDVKKYIIVAHSIGGCVGIELASQLGVNIANFVGVSAVVPRPGKNFFSALPIPQKYIMPIIVRFAGTKPPESAIRSGLGNDLREEDIKTVIALFQPESKKLYLDSISSESLPNIAYTYIRTTNDKEVDPAVQDTVVKNLPNPTVHDIDSGHLPMLTHAKEISLVINNLL